MSRDRLLEVSAWELEQIWLVTKANWTPENVARWELKNAAHTALWKAMVAA